MATTLTTNYGWAKPNVGDDTDLWGGHLNADLDSIDSIVFGKLSDASTGGLFYGRQGGAWAQPDHTAITDWNTTLAPYALTSSLSAYAPASSLANYLLLTGGTLTGGIAVGGPVDLLRQVITATATTTINRAAGENVALTLGVAITTFNITGWVNNYTSKLRLIIANTGGNTIAWPSGTKWPGGTPPTLSASGKTDIILLMSDNGGTTIYGSVVGLDYR